MDECIGLLGEPTAFSRCIRRMPSEGSRPHGIVSSRIRFPASVRSSDHLYQSLQELKVLLNNKDVEKKSQ